jgi:hypothetical protein
VNRLAVAAALAAATGISGGAHTAGSTLEPPLLRLSRSCSLYVAQAAT